MTEMIHEDVDRPDDLPEDAIYDGDPEPHINSDADAESSLESIVYWERKREEARSHHEKMVQKLASWWRRRTDHFDRKIGWHEAALEFYLNNTGRKKIDLYNGTISKRKKPLKVIKPPDIEQHDMVVEQLKRNPAYTHMIQSKVVDTVDTRAVLAHHRETGEIPPGLEIERGPDTFVVALDTKEHITLS